MRRERPPFIGRRRELAALNGLRDLPIPSLVVIKGRRRIGKSRLADEFSRPFRTLRFMGLAPENGVSARAQREHFANQLKRQLSLVSVSADDWDDLFALLAAAAGEGPVVVILDEINWMGSKDRTFLPKLKSAWDLSFSKNPELILILSGSMSGWIEKNILSSTGFFGRVNLNLTLHELPLHQCGEFWGSARDRIAAYEKFKVLSVTGGVPRYLEVINPGETAEQNIQRLCFSSDGILFTEFDRIFSDLFSSRSAVYKTIVEQVARRACSLSEILKGMGVGESGTVAQYVEDLVETRYLARDYTWELKSGQRSKLSRFRLSDNYLRFYLRYIEPNRKAVETSGSIQPPAWHTIMGLQFENLVLNNLPTIFRMLGIDPADIVQAGPFFQTPTTRRKGCQIDLMIQTKHNTLYLCEIKFSKREVRPDVITEMEEKMANLALPRGFSLRPVLIHVNGVSEALEDAQFFRLIDFSDFFKAS